MIQGIRLVELPKCKMVSSGFADEGNPFVDGGKLSAFDKWWSALDKERTDKFFPRDFMWFDRETQRLVWWYALPNGVTDTNGFDTVDYEGGLYAARVSVEGDDEDGEAVFADIQEWVRQSDGFELDERPGHYDLFHVITPECAKDALGYRQLEIYVPIRVKAKQSPHHT